jgi:hypothetical protein
MYAPTFDATTNPSRRRPDDAAESGRTDAEERRE